MIETIRVGQTRNLLRASSSQSEIWPRSAHHHPGQRRHVSRMNRPDKSTHSITCPDDQKFLANRAASTKEGWISVSLPPPESHCKLPTAFVQNRNSFWFQKGLAESSEPQRLQRRPFSVSDGALSLSERTCCKSVRIKKIQSFQWLVSLSQAYLLRRSLARQVN
jgi:hypothetical protein